MLPGFLPSCHLLNSKTFNTISTMAAEKNSTWKNLIMGLFLPKLKLLMIMSPVIKSLFTGETEHHN